MNAPSRWKRSSARLAAVIEQPGWPEFNYDEKRAHSDQYSTPEWTEHR